MEYAGNNTTVSSSFFKLIQTYVQNYLKNSGGAILSTKKIYTFYDGEIIRNEDLHYIGKKESKLRYRNFNLLKLFKGLNDNDTFIELADNCYNTLNDEIVIISEKKLYFLKKIVAKFTGFQLTPEDELIDCVLLSVMKDKGYNVIVCDFFITNNM